MIVQIFSFYDSKSRTYSNPYAFPNLEVAIRQLQDVMQMPDALFAKHPEDFQLFHLGSFDDELAKFELFPGPQAVLSLVSLKEGSSANV